MHGATIKIIQLSLLLSALYMFRGVFGWVGNVQLRGTVPTQPHQQYTTGKHGNTQGCTYSFISS
jgi:hypothetical protein